MLEEYLSTSENYFKKILNKIKNLLYLIIKKIYLSLNWFHPSVAKACESLAPSYMRGQWFVWSKLRLLSKVISCSSCHAENLMVKWKRELVFANKALTGMVVA